MILSASSLSVFKDCPRCFFNDKVRGIKQPRGIFPSLPGGMDRLLKDRYDSFRVRKILPPELREHFQGSILFQDQIQLRKWQNWRQGLRMKIGDVTLTGAIDELIDNQDASFTIFDYKTRGAAPKEGASEQYYGSQMDIYDLLLGDAGIPTTGEAYLGYWWPCSHGMEQERHMKFPMETTNEGIAYSEIVDVAFYTNLIKVKTSAERARDLVLRAADCLQNTEPAGSPDCPYCKFAGQHVAIRE